MPDGLPLLRQLRCSGVEPGHQDGVPPTDLVWVLVGGRSGPNFGIGGLSYRQVIRAARDVEGHLAITTEREQHPLGALTFLAGVPTGIVATVIVCSAYLAISEALSSVFQVALCQYGIDGATGSVFGPTDIEAALVPRRR